MSAKTKLQKIAERAKGDFYFFCKEILGYSLMSPSPHQDVCNHVLGPGHRKKLTLLPRGSFKSSVVTVGGSLFTLVNNPNERILIASETQKNALKYAREIKAHIELNEKFRAIFGDLVNQNDTWRDFEFTINTRTKPYKECSITASSMEKGVLTGNHFSLIILDDIVSKSNVSTTGQIEKTLDYYRLLMSILDPSGRIWINGTRYSVHDLYGWILDDQNGEREQFDVLVKSAISEDGELLMPEVLTREFLEEQRKTQGPEIFANQYMNQAINAELQVFKPEWIQFFDVAPTHCVHYITIDPAISTKQGADFTAIIVCAVDYQNNWYLEEVHNFRSDMPGIINKLFELAQKYNPIMGLGMEKFILEKAMRAPIIEEMSSRNLFFPILDVPVDTRVAKDARIRSLQPKFERGEIYLRKGQRALIDQVLLYPQVKHDDCLDCLKSLLSIAAPSPHRPPEADPESHLDKASKRAWDDLRKLTRRRVKTTQWSEA